MHNYMHGHVHGCAHKNTRGHWFRHAHGRLYRHVYRYVCKNGGREDGYTGRHKIGTHVHKLTYTYLSTIVRVIAYKDAHKAVHAKLIAHVCDPVDRPIRMPV